jgi:hypothetical protein
MKVQQHRQYLVRASFHKTGGVEEPPTAGEEAAAPRSVEQPTPTFATGNVWDPDLMICVPDLPPPEFCPNGSIRQPNGECPPLPPTIPTEGEQASAEEPEAEEPPAEEE